MKLDLKKNPLKNTELQSKLKLLEKKYKNILILKNKITKKNN